MKYLTSYKIVIILMMIFCAGNLFAQTNNNQVSTIVLTAFTEKYPKADVRHWHVANEEYTANAKEDHHKYFATFDKNGAWIKTTYKFNWPWKLPTVIKNAFKESNYGTWHIYAINRVEAPSGEYYQVMVDNANSTADALHQNPQTINHLLEFKVDGKLISEKNISNVSAL